MNYLSIKACIGRGTQRIFSKIIEIFFGHMMHQIGPEFSQDHEYAIQKILRPLVLELFPKNGNQVRFDQVKINFFGHMRIISLKNFLRITNMPSKKFSGPQFSSYCSKTLIRLGLTRVGQIRLVKLGQVSQVSQARLGQVSKVRLGQVSKVRLGQ